MSESTEIVSASDAKMLETVLVNGDLSGLTPAERLNYYQKVCQSMNLNPLSRPFGYIEFKGKLTLYAKKDATDQLRKHHAVSIDDIRIDEDPESFTVIVKGHDREGRSDVEIGCVSKKDVIGSIENIKMKAVTKAKRRLTLSLCGLGWLDETEIETMPDAKPVIVNDQGEIVEPDKPKPGLKKPFDENEFLAQFSYPSNIPDISTQAAETYTDSNDRPYKDMGIRELYSHWMGLAKRIKTENQAQAELTAMKIGAICRLIQNEKTRRSIKEPNGGRPDPFVGQAE